MLQNELRGKSTKIVMVAFDLLYLNGRDVRKLPLRERKALLKKLIAGRNIQFSESLEVDGPEMFTHACKLGYESVISKVADSAYPTGARSRDWVKKTCSQRETLTIAGFGLPLGITLLSVDRRPGKGLPTSEAGLGLINCQLCSFLERGSKRPGGAAPPPAISTELGLKPAEISARAASTNGCLLRHRPVPSANSAR
ncbi:hypothetical protein BraRD5C2_33480 [Bradyrhizobium sp. RD5-C2]|nr:hypothetical protein BraRD5C2_33480 [Bradyrhizobium sp. RD5-C2]